MASYTILQNSNGNRYVLYLYWNDGKWNWNYNWLDNKWNANNPSAVLATFFISLPIAELQGSLLNVAENEQDPIELLEYAEGYLKNPSIFWKKAKLHTKLKLQWFEFPSGIIFENEKFRTTQIASIYNVKTASCDAVSTGVDYGPEFWKQVVRELEYLVWVLKEEYPK